MTVALVLLGYAALLAGAAPAALRRVRWLERAPRLALTVWLGAAGSVVGACLLAGAAFAVSAGGPGDVLRSCAPALRGACGSPLIVAGIGAGLAAAAVARAGWCVAGEIGHAAALRRRHAAALALIGRPDHDLGAVVVDHAMPAAYCLPGRDGRVVVTTAALDALDADQVRAVLAHERAHLRGRHHLLVAVTGGLERAYPWVPVFRAARAAVARLVELAADDAAARRADSRTVAAALLNLTAGAVPVAAVTGADRAGEQIAAATAGRVCRLLAPRRPLGRVVGALAAGLVVAALAGPAAVATGAALMAAGTVAAVARV